MQDLRRELRRRRAAIQGKQRQDDAQRAAAWALLYPPLQRAQRVAVFLSMAEEIDTAPLIQSLRGQGKALYLPRVTARQAPLLWLPYPENTPLEKDAVGMLCPPLTAEALPAAALDCVLMPLLGWNRRGQRLGMGGGYYDRSFAASNVPRLGFAYACQEALFTAKSWDVPLHALACETALHEF